MMEIQWMDQPWDTETTEKVAQSVEDLKFVLVRKDHAVLAKVFETRLRHIDVLQGLNKDADAFLGAGRIGVSIQAGRIVHTLKYDSPTALEMLGRDRPDNSDEARNLLHELRSLLRALRIPMEEEISGEKRGA